MVEIFPRASAYIYAFQNSSKNSIAFTVVVVKGFLFNIIRDFRTW